ncbi:hypothetical protein GIB67_034579 [Kingdonia uniflora]|uniref:RING-type domain-containing protein n=1 Tax=Kingdonia uniflora TaxID=39325 RepID=A0A7J7MXR3_9MAGN|nr:hypothetical protein GIB67_034579 [Kingdonia uniflora]
MELDLDSFLQLQTSSDEDEDDLENIIIPHRTVDDILNDSGSGSDSSPSSPKRFSHLSLSTRTTVSLSKNDVSKLETLTPTPSISPIQSLDESPKSPETLKSLKSEQFGGSFSRNSLSKNPFLLGRSSSSSLPSLFGGVKANPKPGAALAAAAAASRSRPSLHAAAIKSRRVQKALVSEELSKASDEVSVKVEPVVVVVVDDDSDVGGEISKVNNNENLDEKVVIDSLPSLEESAEEAHSNGENEDFPVNESSESDETKLNSEDLDTTGMVDERERTSSNEFANTENADLDDGIFGSNDVVVEVISKVEEKSEQIEMGTPVLENSNVPVVIEGDDISLKFDINEVVEERLSQLESERESKRASKKSRAYMKPLELAEELEKKYASSGLHWEEGVAAQPMKLEGIRRGPPAVGYLQIDPNNVITRTISSRTFRNSHGSAQVLAVHANFIAVGTSKGLVLVMPSIYDAHNVDNMDASKMLTLRSQGDKFKSPVTSMCFNQQGDLLLVGYGDGNIKVWDVQKAVLAKAITGEHKAPIVHTLFLGQDSQVTRQFKAVTGDCKGIARLHTFSVLPLLNLLSVRSEWVLDDTSSTALSASPLLINDYGSAYTAAKGNVTASPSGIGSMMGGVVGGVVGGEAGWKLFSEGSPMVEEGVVIFVTRQTALVVRFTPSFEVYVRLDKPDGVREGSMPYTAWKCITPSRVPTTENAPSETFEKASLLAIAWDRKVQVAKLVKSDLKVVNEWTLDSAAIGVAWLDDQMLVVLTLRGQLCLFSKEGIELHRTSFTVDGSGADDFIAYHTHFTNIFGNPEKAYHNCVSVRGATIYLLGPMHLVVSRLLPWKERIQVLRKAGDWMGALEMTMRLYDGQAHGVIDLPRTLDGIRDTIMPYLVDLILSYVDEVFSYISVAFCNQLERVEQVNESKGRNCNVHSEMGDQFARVGGVAVEFCVHIKRIDILFDDIFSKFVAVQHGVYIVDLVPKNPTIAPGTFLELLEPYILKDMLGCLPPEIMQALVEHYNSKGWLQRVEQCVLHMDISSLDFNQVVRLCREHGLYGALIYLFNKGLDDFKAPLEELLLLVRDSQRENSAAIAYRMLVYLKYCFSGLAFPPGHGTLPPTRLPSLRVELVQFLLEDSITIESEAATGFKSPAGTLPNLYHLLRLDTEATLEVLNCAFLDEDISKPEDIKDNNYMNKEHHNLLVQNTVNVLIQILDTDIPEVGTSSGTVVNEFLEVWPSRKDIGHLLEFIGYFVAQRTVTISRTILNRMLEYFTLENTSPLPNQKDGYFKGREKQVLNLLRIVPDTDWDSSYVLHICEKAEFYQVCGLIYTIKGQYIAALGSYMKDFDEPIHAFSFINGMLLQLNDAESASFQFEVISRIPELISLSREGAFFLVIDHFYTESERILSDLRSHPNSLFLYLKTIIEVHLTGRLNFSSLEKSYALDNRSGRGMKEQSSECKAYLGKISDFPKLLRDNTVQVTNDMVELYLELLCQYEKNSVLKFLETFENYRVEHCLRLCQEYGVIDAAAFLLERVGDVGSALLLTLSGINEKLTMLDTAVESMVSDVYFSSLTEIKQLNAVSKMTEVDSIGDILHVSIGLCQRNTKRLDHEESEALWFRLLDSFCEPFRFSFDDNSVSDRNHEGTLEAAVKEDKKTSSRKWRTRENHTGTHILKRMFSQFIKEIVEGMIGYVRLPIIMTKLLSDNGNQEFGDLKLTILGMLGTYGFERRILDTAKYLIDDDTFYTMSLLKKGASHGYAPQNLVCCICNCFLTKESSISGIRVFNCGHATHIQCEFPQSEALNDMNSAGCPVCMPKKKTPRLKNKSVLTEHGLFKNSISRSQQIQGGNTVQYPYDSDPAEKQYGLQQISRFEILSNLQSSQRSFQIENLPQLRLAPPAVYHEKVKKRTYVSPGQSSSSSNSSILKSDKTTKNKQLLELKRKGSSIRFPLKSSIFGNEKTRKR